MVKLQSFTTWGVAVYTSSLITVLGAGCFGYNQWSKYTVIAIPGSLLFLVDIFIRYMVLYYHIGTYPYELRGTVSHNYKSSNFLVYVLWTTGFVFAKRWFYTKYYKRNNNTQQIATSFKSFKEDKKR